MKFCWFFFLILICFYWDWDCSVLFVWCISNLRCSRRWRLIFWNFLCCLCCIMKLSVFLYKWFEVIIFLFELIMRLDWWILSAIVSRRVSLRRIFFASFVFCKKVWVSLCLRYLLMLVFVYLVLNCVLLLRLNISVCWCVRWLLSVVRRKSSASSLSKKRRKRLSVLLCSVSMKKMRLSVLNKKFVFVKRREFVWKWRKKRNKRFSSCSSSKLSALVKRRWLFSRRVLFLISELLCKMLFKNKLRCVKSKNVNWIVLLNVWIMLNVLSAKKVLVLSRRRIRSDRWMTKSITLNNKLWWLWNIVLSGRWRV